MICRFLSLSGLGATPRIATHAHRDGLDEMEMLKSTVYTAIGTIVALVFVVAILVIAVCRIRMKREASRRLTSSRTRRQGQRSTTWQQTTPYIRPPDNDDPYVDFTPPHRCSASTNLAVNINLGVHLGQGYEMTSLLSPPPYAEVVNLPQDDMPPPPYSTLDRPTQDAANPESAGLIANDPDNNAGPQQQPQQQQQQQHQQDLQQQSNNNYRTQDDDVNNILDDNDNNNTESGNNNSGSATNNNIVAANNRAAATRQNSATLDNEPPGGSESSNNNNAVENPDGTVENQGVLLRLDGMECTTSVVPV